MFDNIKMKMAYDKIDESNFDKWKRNVEYMIM